MLQLYSEVAAEIPPGRAGPWRRCSRPTRHRARIDDLLRSAAVLVRAVRGGRGRARRLPAARHHPAADGDVPFLGLAERLAAPDPRRATGCYIHRAHGARARHRGRRLGLGRSAITAASRRRCKLMDGVNPRHGLDLERDRQARRRLEPGAASAPRRSKGFLLNHMISELLPERDGRPSLRQCRSGHRPGGLVRPARAAREGAPPRPAHERAAIRRRCRAPPASPQRPAVLRYGADVPRAARGGAAMTSLPAQPLRPRSSAWSSTSTSASAATPAPSTARNGTAAAIAAPLTDIDPYGAEPRRRLVQPRPHLRGGRGPRRPHRAFPALLPALRRAGLRHGLPDRRLLQARRGRHRAGQRGSLHRLQAVLLGLPLRRARVRRGSPA